MGDGAWRFVGHDVGPQELDLIRSVVGQFAELSREELAATVCELLGWTRATGRLKARECREFLERLETAGVIGLPPKRVGLIGFGIGSALAGIAGSLASTIYVITPTVGLLFTIKAFTVMVVGGLGSQVGILLAGLSLGILESFASFLIGAEYKDLSGYVLLIGFIVWKSRTSAAFAGEVK